MQQFSVKTANWLSHFENNFGQNFQCDVFDMMGEKITINISGLSKWHISSTLTMSQNWQIYFFLSSSFSNLHLGGHHVFWILEFWHESRYSTHLKWQFWCFYLFQMTFFSKIVTFTFRKELSYESCKWTHFNWQFMINYLKTQIIICMSSSSHIWSVLIGIEYWNCHQIFVVYLLFTIWMEQIQSKLIYILVTYELTSL